LCSGMGAPGAIGRLLFAQSVLRNGDSQNVQIAELSNNRITNVSAVSIMIVNVMHERFGPRQRPKSRRQTQSQRLRLRVTRLTHLDSETEAEPEAGPQAQTRQSRSTRPLRLRVTRLTHLDSETEAEPEAGPQAQTRQSRSTRPRSRPECQTGSNQYLYLQGYWP
jgi:hypothetical protein